MSPATIPGALHVSQNGALVSGTVQVTDNGQTIQFTPSGPFQNNALSQVFLDSTAVDSDGESLTNFQGALTTAAKTSEVGASVVNTSPADDSTGVTATRVIM